MGIVIADKENRGKGIGVESLTLITNYAFSILKLHQLFANVGENNTASIQLFTKNGFTKSGVKRDWNYSNGTYKNEILFQKINI